MTHDQARLALAAILSDGYAKPAGTVAYVYCEGTYAVFLSTREADYVLRSDEAVDVYRTSHRPAGEG